MDKDGLITDIYSLLWRKTDLFIDEDKRFCLNIPDTIIFRDKKIMSWFFTAKNGEFLKKVSDKLNKDDIFRRLSKNCSKTGIAAYLLSNADTETDKLMV